MRRTPFAHPSLAERRPPLWSIPVALSLALLAPAAAAQESKGEIQVPLAEVERLHSEIERLTKTQGAPPALQILSRRFVGEFAQGQLDGTLTVRIRAAAPHLKPIPLVTRSVAISAAKVDGRDAMPLPIAGGGVGLIANTAGEHTLQLSFSSGRKEERFQRQVVLPFGAAAQTKVELAIDESDIDVNVDGVLLEQRKRSRTGGTVVLAVLNVAHNPKIVWRRQLTHAEREAPVLEATVHTLVTPRIDLVRTESRLRFRILRGEADRVRVAVPPGVEVSHVSGPAVLQWVTEREGDSGRTLVVLFKHLIDRGTDVNIKTQAPVVDDKTVHVRPMAPLAATVRSGLLAIAGRAGFELETTAEGAVEMSPSELPQSVIEMTQDPLLQAFTYEDKTPQLTLAMKQNETLSLTQALVDDLEAATVMTETGALVTKVRLKVRNTSQQHLRMRIPQDAEVTHALIDGTPFTPGKGVETEGAAFIDLLIPLRQSEKVAQRRHVVGYGETLGEISLRYFNRTSRWQDILVANGMAHPSDSQPGQVLIIPPDKDGQTHTESAFTLEVAYRTPAKALALFGRRDLTLPKLDLPVMRVAWHVYLPLAIEPLRFESNLQQLDGVRYDPLRRVRQFFDAALRVRGAWAGGVGYENILRARKRIFRAESRQQAQEALSDFPLAGERTRFRRVLLRDDEARIALTYAQKDALPLVQALAFLLTAFVVFALGRKVRRQGGRRALLSAEAALFGGVTACLLFVAMMVLGTHRAMLLGANAGLLAMLLPHAVVAVKQRTLNLASVPVDLGRWLRGRTVFKLVALCVAFFLVLSFPLLLSTFTLVVLLTVAWRKGSEVSHA